MQVLQASDALFKGVTQSFGFRFCCLLLLQINSFLLDFIIGACKPVAAQHRPLVAALALLRIVAATAALPPAMHWLSYNWYHHVTHLQPLDFVSGVALLLIFLRRTLESCLSFLPSLLLFFTSKLPLQRLLLQALNVVDIVPSATVGCRTHLLMYELLFSMPKSILMLLCLPVQSRDLHL